MSRIVLVILAFIGITSCTAESDGDKSFVDANPNDVEIKVDNRSSYSLKDFKVNTYGAEKNFGSVGPGRVTDYESFPYAYSYVGINFKVNEVEFEYDPTEYSSDDRIEGDRYEIILLDLDTVKQTFSFQLRFVE